ncbi:MAG TPA: hypothetical protein VKU00_00540 [Chthonomonadaceae bacterium]|nr:hypothetical protein [Chthonomonadaceae bacterium]
MDKQNRGYKNKVKSVHKAPLQSTPSRLPELPPVTTEDATTPKGKQGFSTDKKK